MFYYQWQTILIGTLLFTGLFSGCSQRDARSTSFIPPVENFDTARYMGSWYEIARLPHSFERGMTDGKAVYTLQDNGTVKVLNSGLLNGKLTQVSGRARQLDHLHTGELEVSFFGPFYGLYKIIYLNNDYTLAIVTSSTMDYLWILARKPVISREELKFCIAMLKKWGFQIKLLQYPSGMIEKL